MQKITRRQWILRTGTAALTPIFLSSCRPGSISRDVKSVSPRIADAYVPLELTGCVACDNCMPCPYGIDIPSNFLFVDRAIDEGKAPRAIDSPDFSEKGAKFLSMYENKIPDEAQTQRCIGCGRCSGVCPAGIDISAQMLKITALTDVLRSLRCRQL